ncbi:peptidoglycan DD-metalloendopeptidase family protein [Streptomyces sp. SKN60]|uniref:M23 family metallopeptidase n=1 Tax=Streptomyces sp. SKN60 TaxID=2855506 RepID=UPI0022452A26|nr:peptidoglycan DD-metalloendopeptidase family protein [Streptomyces sp. SKN60]MCX2184417.1 peptidoglycan DD-metalloendopeptidase family protein [Streptomyces sp. SKN60]
MNDQHPHAGYVTDATQTTGSFAVDPLFGTGATGTEYASAYGYDTGQSAYGDYTGYADQSGQSGQWDTGSYGSYTATGQWDATAWTEAQQTGQYEAAAFASYDTTAQWTTPGYETGAYDATAWNQGTAEPIVPQQYTPDHSAEFSATEFPAAEYAAPEYSASEYGTAYDSGYAYAEYPAYSEHAEQPELSEHAAYADYTDADYADAAHETYADAGTEREHGEPDSGPDTFHDAETMVALELDGAALAAKATAPGAELPARPVRRAGGGSRGRRRTPAKRSALLTVAVPSACVMGVAGIAAASVSGLTDSGADQKDDTTSLAAADPASVQQVAANSKLDTQLAALSADARDFGDRASRTQERIDLKLRQEAEKKKREEEAARKEALRPKFLLPVKLHQLSARYGQAGVNWMSLHTGIDFPVQYGTPVMAATDGTVRTQWNSAYGNMAIVTSPDGTETWYCHLSSTKIRSGKVKAGDVIAYSGNSGNSTGPHLHFEVRPGGGSAIDPLPWLLKHGLDPTS